MTEQEMEIVQGSISAVIFQNYDNGYAVLRLNVGGDQNITVVGTIPLPAVGEQLMVTGKWSNHSSYGRQFEAEFLERLLPQSSGDILRYLSGRIIKGIGPKTAARIVQRFGADTLVVIEREPERLSEVSGISAEKAKAIGEEFRLRMGMRQLMEFFTLHQLPAELAVRTYKLYGENTVELLYNDPYLLMDEGLEAPFGAVDRFAIALGVDGDDHRRIRAGVLFELKYNLTAGHSFLPKDKLTLATAQLLSVTENAVAAILEEMLDSQLLVEGGLAGITVIYLPELHEAEVFSAGVLLEKSGLRYPAPKDLETWIEETARKNNISYSPQQREAISQAATNGLLLITGGPGTGKTTILRAVLALYQELGMRVALAAPTGRAAKRLSEVTGMDASTLHRLLGATVDPATGKMIFLRSREDPIPADAIIVDEMSMVDIQLLDSLLRAVAPGKRMVLVGDPDQLPPVGPGFPFGDMLRSGMLPSVRLTEIFRQAQESLIVMNAHRVNQGEMPELKNVRSDFFFLPCRSEEELRQTVTGLCTTRLPQKMGIPADQIQVLSPTRKGGVGTGALNMLLQSALNPAAPTKKERQFGDFSFREGDRVMQIRNNYDILWRRTDGSATGAGVFNGDIGTVSCIDPHMETLTVVYDDREVDYGFDQLNELEPAFAMTVHKSQGSEYRAVILCAWNGHPNLLSRSVLYTAITRAKELLIIAGRQETVAAMTENTRRGTRYSGLKLRLQGKA